MSGGTERIATAVRTHARRAAKYHAPTRVYKAIVVARVPFTVELIDSPIRLDSDALIVTNSVRAYDTGSGILVGDTVLVLKDGEDWIVIDVIAQADPVVGGVSLRAQYEGHGSGDPIPNGEFRFLTWETKNVGDTLLNISVPTAPSAIAGHEYAMTVMVAPTVDLTPGGNFTAVFQADRDGEAANCALTSAPATAAEPRPSVSLPLTYDVPAGGIFVVGAWNYDGVAERAFRLNAMIKCR